MILILRRLPHTEALGRDIVAQAQQRVDGKLTLPLDVHTEEFRVDNQHRAVIKRRRKATVLKKVEMNGAE